MHNNALIDNFGKYIERHSLFTRDDKILLTVSGGVDSMVMLSLFAESGYDIGVAHCNFGLRGAESDEDEEVVAREAAKYGVVCYDRRAQSRTTDRFLLCIRLSAVLEYVQRQRLRSVPFGAARSAGKPYVLLGAAVDRRRTGIDRGIRRSGVPYYAAHVGTMARSDRLYLSDRYSGRCRAEYPPPHPSPSRLSVSGENRFFRCGRNLVFGK